MLEVLPNVVSIIDRKEDPLQVSCAVPVYIAAKAAAKDGLKIMLSGQGGDELFGGYARYLKEVGDKKKLTDVMKRDVKRAYDDNLNRDMAMAKAHDIELRFPFMNDKLGKFVMNDIPVEFKIKSITDEKKSEFSCIDEMEGSRYVRKYILRKVAKEFGVPNNILNRPKKALQYGSHSMKMLDKIAKEEGFSGKNRMRAYLESLLS